MNERKNMIPTPLEVAQAAKDKMIDERRQSRESMSKADFRVWNSANRDDHRAISDRVEALTVHGRGYVVRVGPLTETNEQL